MGLPEGDRSTLAKARRFGPAASLPLLVLAGQNLAIFYGHYFLGVGIPWDFWSGYYPRTAFFIRATQDGVFPAWNPYQSMGYPLVLNLQAGMFYPPNWAFVLVGARYTLEAAATLHGLHVFLGSLGMFAWLGLFFPAPFALLGATAFQFFGGFYSNAEHVDITRAFALLPWIFWSATSRLDGARTRRVLGLPLFVFLLATGGYPGNLVASVWVVLLYSVLQACRSSFPSPGMRYRAVLQAVAFLFLGLAMAVAHLGPAAVYRGELTRTAHASWLGHPGLPLRNLVGLYLSNRRLAGEPSMSSTFITLPVLMGVGLLPLAWLRRHAPQAVVLVASLAMVLGETSPVRDTLYALVPPLAWSVQVSSDYRIFVALMLTFFGIAGIQAVVEGALSRRGLMARLAAVVVLLAAGQAAWSSWPPNPFTGTTPATAALPEATNAVVALVCVLVLFRLERSRHLVPATACLIALVLVQGACVVWDMGFCWRFPAQVRREALTDWQRGGSVAPLSRPGPRPARERSVKAGDDAWLGHMSGRYLMGDRGHTTLRARERVDSSPELSRYMLQEWTPILLDGHSPPSEWLPAPLPEAAPVDRPGRRVVQTEYAINRIEYRVELDREATLLENEIYFPGWQAELRGSDGTQRIRAFAITGALRAWNLPAGSYQMTAHFEFPHYFGFVAGSVLAWAGWAVIVAMRHRWTG